MAKHKIKSFALPLQSAYPKKITFGTETYRIKFRKRLDCYGETDPVAKTITLKDGLSPRLLLTTLVHELLHVIEFEQPVKIKHKIVYELEKGIMEILLDNFL